MQKYSQQRYKSIKKIISKTRLLRNYSVPKVLNSPKQLKIDKFAITTNSYIKPSISLLKPRSSSVQPKTELNNFLEKQKKEEKQSKKKSLEISCDNDTSIYSETEEINYFKFKIRGKEIPMNIEIKDLIGEIIIFYSQVTRYPNELSNDKTFVRTKFKIFEHNSKQTNFTSNMAYLGIKSKGPASYSLSVSFGISFDTSKRVKREIKIEEDSLDFKIRKSKDS